MADPNIVLLFADQLRAFEIGCYGNQQVPTPNIDRLAAMGVRFEHACTTNPVCTPARSSLISGQYGRSCIGMLGCCGDPADKRVKFPDTTLPELLSIGENGYHTCLSGKWHIEPNPLLLGFDQACYPLVAHANVGQTYFDGKGNCWLEEGYCPDAELAYSCDFIRTARQNPFFLYHNFALPHMPFYDMPAKYRDKFTADDVQLRDNVFHQGKMWHDEYAMKVYWTNWRFTTGIDPEKYDWLPDNFDLRALTALYDGMVTAVDDQLGTILDCLEESGQLENTVILFSSDHGENLGSHWLWNKISVNDEAIRIPFIAAWPGSIPAGTADQHIASLVDVAPTLLSLAGRPIPAHMPGRDLTPILRGETAAIGDGAAIIENLYGEIAVRTPTHLYSIMTRTRDDGPQREIIDEESLFYDMTTDQLQLNNLAGSSEQQPLAEQLKECLLTWDRETPWMPTSLGGIYAQGAQHDQEMRPEKSFGVLPTK